MNKLVFNRSCFIGINSINVLEEEIAKQEELKSALETKMSNPEVYSNGAKAKQVQSQIDEISLKLEELNTAWEKAMENL